MGSQLTVLAGHLTLALVLATGGAAYADPVKARELFKLGIDEYNAERVVSFVALGAGAAMIGVAIWRWTRGDDTTEATRELAVSPTAGGSVITFSSRW